MTPYERKAFLNINFNLDGFKIIESKYKNILSELKAELKALNNLDDYKSYINNDLRIEKLNNILVDVKNKINNCNSNIIKQKKEYDKLVNNLKPIDEKFKNKTFTQLEEIIKEQNEIINENKNNLLKFKKYDFTDNKYIHNLYEKNIELTRKLINFDDDNLDIDKLKTELEEIKIKISKLDMIKSKEEILINNKNFEKEKINKIIELKSKILPDSSILNNKKISNKYITYLKYLMIYLSKKICMKQELIIQ